MHKLYVLIKDEMSVAYQGVQGGHCAVQYILDNPGQSWNNDYLIFLECPNLKKWKRKVKMKGLEYTEFKEPDQDNITTAIAVYADTKIFSKLKLIGT